jgi:hypothetical protein
MYVDQNRQVNAFLADFERDEQTLFLAGPAVPSITRRINPTMQRHLEQKILGIISESGLKPTLGAWAKEGW